MEQQQSFFLFFMCAAFVSSLIFGLFYYLAGSSRLALVAGSGALLFLLLGGVSFLIKNLVFIFRGGVFAVFLLVFFQTFFTGGATSPTLPEFIIPPLLAFFYRPTRDRYVVMAVSFCAILSFFVLTWSGYTFDDVAEDMKLFHGGFCGLFVFLIVAVFSVLFRSAIVAKNEKLGTSMKQLQSTTQKLIESEKMASLGVLSAGVAHEINNPLNFIKGGLDMLEDDLKDIKSPEKEQYVSAIKEGLKRAGTIVNSLGHFSRQTTSMDEQCDIHSILDNCVIMLQPKLKYKGTVIKNYDKLPAVTLGNEGRLHQAFLNMISNAEQAIPEDGTIEISTKVQSKKISIQIQDDGAGISKENLHKISDPFFTTKPVGQGTGLGLAITYRIIKEHNGEIKVSSTLNKGTKFAISFPRQ